MKHSLALVTEEAEDLVVLTDHAGISLEDSWNKNKGLK